MRPAKPRRALIEIVREHRDDVAALLEARGVAFEVKDSSFRPQNVVFRLERLLDSTLYDVVMAIPPEAHGLRLVSDGPPAALEQDLPTNDL